MIYFNEKIVNNASFIVKNPFLILALLRNYFLLILKKKPLRMLIVQQQHFLTILKKN